MRRVGAVLAAVMLTALLDPAPASAIQPPVVEPGPPPNGPLGPPEPTDLKAICGVPTGVLPQTDFSLQTSAEAMLNYTAAWRFSRGAGQKVAVIDTGVNRHPRLPLLEGGGDYVSNTDGLQDCDAHGTLVAGLIAAAPSPADGFAGVAPEATILSIRQNSTVYGVKEGGSGQANDPNATSPGYGNTVTLAYAITRAVSLGATVINLSEVACSPVGGGLDDAQLGRAVRYAYERNVVVVAAAGNFNNQGLCKVQNAMPDPNMPLKSGWDSVRTIASPAWFSDYVLTVGALTTSGEPADFSLHGPWVGVAAPGERIISLDSGGPGLINAVMSQQGLAPINGTSFAAPFVSGVVALIRSRFPELNAGQVIDLVKRTAHTPGAGPNEATGYGVVDPIAALTYRLPAANQMPNPEAAKPIAGRPHRDPSSQRARIIVLSVTAGAVALAGVAWAFAVARRRRDSDPAS
ncbi:MULTISPECIES: type VII secretion-associated serine protease mycosin [unclassified Mycobacterium]|uniref:type VII secretion-associated serine protease mycosin n=1 Tax=unclassified Mycobacterium TaxID=2642494 RepID=UPI000F9B08B6|nr:MULTISPECIES: type VII secretion-associated serine protease mycosin [unclassified Mycobacterium]MDP7705227.1 type VII secretion-associated serine protease mycosin [Mycobacterium sp. TY815]MDP7723546.1 type VII secretion-associated serine protease mycosin [Mycobacterium sp. TY814]RUP02458.1 MAG: type VII secretion-associated serine protease mycosin [Mycobacterium sp.]